MSVFTDQAAREYLLKNEASLQLLEKKTDLVWSKRFPTASPAAIDLLTKLLSFNPKKRISVYEAIQHEYFAAITKLETPPTS